MRIVLTLFLISFINLVKAQQSISKKELEDMYNKIEQVIDDDWFIHPQPSGFDLYYCRSCKLKFEEWRKSDDAVFFHETISTSFRDKKRYEFFSPEKADSMSYFPVINAMIFSWNPDDSIETNQRKRDYYKPEDVMRIQYRFEKKWSQKDSLTNAANNQLLEKSIMEQKPAMLPHKVFEDYRYFVPHDYLKRYTSDYDFFFVQLPYTSDKYNYSVFLTIDGPDLYTSSLLVDQKDPWFFNKPDNFIKDERDRTMLIISYVLGLKDFRFLW